MARRKQILSEARWWTLNAAITLCAPATRGILIDLLAYMHKRRTWRAVGTAAYLCKIARCTEEEFAAAVAEMAENGAVTAKIDGKCYLVSSDWMKSRVVSMTRTHLRKEIRRDRDKIIAKLKKRDGDGCRHCGTTDNLTVDHRHPIAAGGGNRFKNLQLLCQSCNSRKGAR